MKMTDFFNTKLIVAGLMLVPLCACGPWFKPVKHVAPRQRMPKDPAERNFKITWDSALKALRDYNFDIERQDPRAGEIITYAEVPGHLVEGLWRKDLADASAVGENFLHLIYRAVKVQVIRIGETSTYKYKVTVLKARSDAQNPSITSSSQISSLTGAGRPVGKMNYKRMRKPPRLTYDDLTKRMDGKTKPIRPVGGSLRPRKPSRPEEYLVPLGRDKFLENRIKRQIDKNIASYRF